MVSVNQQNRLNGYESYSHLKSQEDFFPWVCFIGSALVGSTP
jgi:hypothetical protein